MKLACAERQGNCRGYPGFGEHQHRATFCHFGFHLLLACDRFRATHLGTRPRHSRVRFGLVALQASSDVFSDINIRDVDRDDLKCRVRVQTPR